MLLQAGKTKASLNVAYISILLGMSVVFISMNSLIQGKQLKKRVTEYNTLSFNTVLENMKRSRRIPIIQLEEITNSYVKNNKGKTDRKKFEEEPNNRTLLNMLNGSNPGLIWCMGNFSRMPVLRTLLKKFKTAYTLIGDEFDQLVPYDNNRVMDEYYSRIHKNSYMVIGATATSIKVWLNHSINFQTVTSLPIPAEYVGFKDYAIETLPFDCSALAKKDVESDSMRKICDYLKLLIDKDGYTNLTNKVTGKTGCNHPLHILVNVSRIMDIHSAIFNYMSLLETSNNFTVVTANSDNSGYKVYDSYFLKMEMTNINIPIYGSSESEHCVRRTLDNRTKENFFRMTKATYGDILTYFSEAYKNKGKKIGNIFVIGGDIFSRGMAFTSNNYEISPTDMIYLPSTSACIDTMIQASGRLSGCYFNFHDQIKYVLHTTEQVIKDTRSGIEETSFINKNHGDSNKYLTLNDKLNSGDVKVPGVLKTTRKNFKAGKGKQTKLNQNIYAMDGGEEINISAVFDDEIYTTGHNDMYLQNRYKNGKASIARRNQHLKDTGKKVILPSNEEDKNEKTYTETLCCAIKKYIDLYTNEYMTVSEWCKITGLCGFKNKTTYHHALMTCLVTRKFMERHNNKLRMLFIKN